MRGEPFGSLNDAGIVVQYLMALPLIVALHDLRPRGRVSTASMLLGLTGVSAITVLQVLLLAHVLTFQQQGGPVSAALFILFGGWLLITAYQGRRVPRLRYSVVMSVLGWTYFGYPIWAFWLGRRLRSTRESSVDQI